MLKSIVEGAGSIIVGKELTHLSKINIQETSLQAPPIKFPDGNLHIENDAALHGVFLDLKIGKTISGRAECKSGLFEKILFKHLKHACSLDLDVRGLRVKTSPEQLDCSLATASIKSLTYNANDIALVCKNVRIENMSVSGELKAPNIALGFVSCDSIELKMPSKQFLFKEIEFGKGLTFNSGKLKCPSLSCSTYECNLETILSDKKSPIKADTPSAKMAFNDDFLDALSGNIHADLKANATVPVIGKRKATHRFRIPIENGVINYKTLEESLSDLENAFIDFNLKGNMLVLARDIPLIPGFEKPIVSWAIKNNEMELAENNKVKLACLLHPILAEAKPNTEQRSKSKLKLHTLDFDSMNIDLECERAVVLTSNQGNMSCQFKEMGLKGRLFYDHDKTSQVTQTSLGVDVFECALHFNAFEPIGDVKVHGEFVFQKKHSLQTVFQGLLPKSAHLSGNALKGSNLVLQLLSIESVFE